MNQLNSIILEGNVCKEPEIKEINGERNLATFSIAVNRYYKKADVLRLLGSRPCKG